MTYFETELLFTQDSPAPKTAVKSIWSLNDLKHTGAGQAELLGITMRLGNKPLVYNLEDLRRRSGKPDLSSEQDHYLIVHVISALRTKGKARIDELQYCAVATHPESLQTVDLIPKTRFNEVMRADTSVNIGLDIFGEVSPVVPSGMIGKLLNEFISIGPGMQLQFSTSTRFIGKLSYSLQIPVVQASGIGSGSCSWILKPDENKTPLLGDQLLVQSIAVPGGTRRIAYSISGVVKADKGILWKQQEKRTPDHTIEVDLEPLSSRKKV